MELSGDHVGKQTCIAANDRRTNELACELRELTHEEIEPVESAG